MTRRRSPAQTFAEQTQALALATPQVVAHRVGRMMAAGPLPSARDQAEFQRMVGEKVQTFGQSWSAMWLQAGTAQMQALTSLWTRPGQPLAWMGTPASNPWLKVMNAGMAPVRTKAVANARRLGRSRG